MLKPELINDEEFEFYDLTTRKVHEKYSRKALKFEPAVESLPWTQQQKKWFREEIDKTKKMLIEIQKAKKPILGVVK